MRKSGEGPAGDPRRRLRSPLSHEDFLALLERIFGAMALTPAQIGKAEAKAAGEAAELSRVHVWKEDPVATAEWLTKSAPEPELPLHLDPLRHRFYYAPGLRQKEEQFPEPGDRCASCEHRRDAHPKVFGGDGDPTVEWLAGYLMTLGLYEARKEDK